ncbi:MAG: hypothetical protein NTZ26_00640 [Candidatus Aminicenantes bacterium]|nr:hypothetical protein [Candidatus Aminicenantes bacterium]
MKFAGIFALVVGMLMIGQWAANLATNGIPELATAPLSIGFHLAAEILTALALVLSGLAILKKLSWGRSLFLVAGGMALYSIINSPGYFAQKSQWPMVALFGGLFFAAVFALMAAAFDHD